MAGAEIKGTAVILVCTFNVMIPFVVFGQNDCNISNKFPMFKSHFSPPFALGIIARDPKYYPYLKQALTEQVIYCQFIP